MIHIAGPDALEQGVTGVFFPHGIGHLLGLQVHDVGGVMGDVQGGERKRPDGHPYLRLTRMLEPGVVVTVEPGIYLIDSLLKAAHEEKRPHIDWAVVDELRPYGGIRIEDNVVATAAAPENMTRDAFANRRREASRPPTVSLFSSRGLPCGAWVRQPRPPRRRIRRSSWSSSAPCALGRLVRLLGAVATASTSCISAMSAESPGRGSIFRIRV